MSSRPLDIADNIDALATELMTIDSKYGDPVGRIFAATTDVRALTPPEVRRWSDPRAWPTGKVPTRNDNVVIDQDILIDIAECKRLDIVAGTAVLAEGGKLETFDGSIVVHDGATFKATTGDILFHVTNDRLFTGNSPTTDDDHSATDYGLWGLEGSTVILNGPPMLNWTWVAARKDLPPKPIDKGVVAYPAIGTGVATLGDDPVGWAVNDTLLLVAVDGTERLARLESIDGRKVTFRGADDFVAPALYRADIWDFPFIANLSKRLRIVSADVKEGDTNHRAHVACMHHGHYHFRSVELRNIGARGKLGRYPMHFHHAGHAEHGSGIENCSIWQDVTESGNRGIAIHNTQGATVTGNVLYRCHGHAIFTEDSRETGNIVMDNLVVGTTGPEELNALNSPPKSPTQAIWAYTGNTVDRNVTAGKGTSGILILPAATRPNEVAVVKEHSSYGCKPYGMWSRAGKTIWDQCSSVYASSAGIGCVGGYGIAVAQTEINGCILWLNGTEKTTADPYQTGIFTNQCGDVTVVGGQIAAKFEAVHSHYRPVTVAMENVDIEAAVVWAPTYWECLLRLTGGKRIVTGLFAPAYPPRTNTCGFALMPDGFVGNAYAHLFPGAVQIPNACQVPIPLPPAGFIAAPTGGKFWTIKPVNSPVVLRKLYRSENEARWRASLATWTNGYPDGMPPGKYEVAFYTTDTSTVPVKQGIVEVKSGEVVSLP